MNIWFIVTFVAAVAIMVCGSAKIPQTQERWLTLPFKKEDVDKFKITEGWYYSEEEKAIHGNVTHYGVDFAAPRGTPVVAAADGLMIGSFHSTYSGQYQGKRVGFGLGNFVQIWHEETGFYTCYAHLDSFAPSVPFIDPDKQVDGTYYPTIVNGSLEELKRRAKPVKRGEVIGYIGDSGCSWGYDELPREKRDHAAKPSWDETHVHFEVYQRDASGKKTNRTDPYGKYAKGADYNLTDPGLLWMK